jgi:hypothetical protein
MNRPRLIILTTLAIGLLTTIPGYAQSTAALGLIQQGIGAAESFGSLATSMAAQHQAYEQQREALEQQRQMMEQQRQMMEQQRQGQMKHPCPIGYHHADAVLADGSQAEVCVRNQRDNP